MSWEKLGISKKNRGLGFWDLHFFNQVLLAKQCWRLLKNKDSLVLKIMKGKYYPRSSILEATCGNCPSFAWRSIQGSCDILKKGLIWRIGNGNNIKIWGEKWLPKPTTYTVQSPPNTLNRELLVCDLIDPDSRWLNPIILQENFTPEERHLIQSISIGSAHQQD